MADEPVPTTTGTPVEPPVETPPETQVATPPEPPAPPETPPAAVAGATETQRTWKLKHGGQEVEISDEAELTALAQKGLDYNARVQALQEADRGRQAQDQLSSLVLNNPAVLKAEIARQNGIDPRVVLSDPQVPDEGLREYNPDLYHQQKYAAQLHAQQKAWVDSVFENTAQMTRTQVNNAVFEVARATNDLSDEDYKRVRQFVESRLRPSPAGTYSKEDVEFGVKAVMGERQSADERLAQTRRIQETVRRAGSTTPAQPAPRPEEIPEDVAKARAFKDFVKDYSGS